MNREMGVAMWATRIWDNSEISFRKVAENMSQPSCAYIACRLGKGDLWTGIYNMERKKKLSNVL